MLIFATQKQIKEMKGKYSVIVIGIATMLSMFFASCGKDRWVEYYPYTYQSIWIDSVMRADYLWNDELTDEDELTSSYFLNSVDFLNKVKFSEDNVSSVDTAYSTPAASYGYELALSSVNDTAYIAVATYVEPSSPAGVAGLQRGEWIMAIDGELITSTTETMLQDGDAHTLSIGSYVKATIVNEDGEEEEVNAVTYNRDINLPAATSFFSDDLPVVSVVNSQVGYMLYNNITEANRQKVAAASQSLAASGITDMVLDLRYAASGDISGLQFLASVLAPTSALGTKMATVQYAESRHMDTSLSFLSTSELDDGVNLNLSKLYVLTSSGTAGPAEMLVNCLKTSMEVVVIGQQTQGIGVACETYHDPARDQLLHLAVCQVKDANGNADYVGTGIEPDFSVNPLSPVEGILPFGDPSEILLAKALEEIEK